METYRVIDSHEENPYERNIGDLATKVFCLKNKLSDDIRLGFIVEDFYHGKHVFDGPILGFCARDGREIFVHYGLSERDLISTVAHEVRHAWQAKTGRHCLDREHRERDARLAELEANIPTGDAREIRLWLLRELEFERTPGLREVYSRVDQLMLEARATPTKREYASNSRHGTLYKSKGERINYIKTLLSKLPADSKYQRANLQQELTELVAA